MTVAPDRTRPAWRESLNFLLANRIPRRLATRLMGWFSHIESPLLARGTIALWRRFSDLDLSESQTDRFRSLHACFTRELKPGARIVNGEPGLLTGPSDGIVIACGSIRDGQLLQVKGSFYPLQELVLDPQLADNYRNGQYVTLRLTPSMYHRFHAPHDCTVEHVSYIAGDTWNVNPPALKRVPKLYCLNERAIIRVRLTASGHCVTLVPVAAILVAGIRLHFLDLLLAASYRGEAEIPCSAALSKGEEMGWFEHGSTIIVLAPPGFTLCEAVREGARMQMGQPLLRLPPD
jgi:phosphatidylserine decarboxylase